MFGENVCKQVCNRQDVKGLMISVKRGKYDNIAMRVNETINAFDKRNLLTDRWNNISDKISSKVIVS